MRVIITLLFSFFFFSCFSQLTSAQNYINRDHLWYEGSILLTNGRELKGLVKYNEKQEILAYENGALSKSFTPRNVIGFEYYDEQENKQRLYCSVTIEEVEQPLFLEVMMETSNFAVLSKKGPLRMDKKYFSMPLVYNLVTGSSGGNYYSSQTNFYKTETLYLLKKGGVPEPYLKNTEKEIEGFFSVRKKIRNTILNEDIIKEYTAPRYKQLVAFAKENELSFEKKADLLKILDFYKTLSVK